MTESRIDPDKAKRIIEALLFVFSQPLALKRILSAIPELQDVPVRQLIEELNAEYVSSKRAFHIREVAGGYQIATDQELAPWVSRALNNPKPDSVSAASLETLAIIAYRQPITKAEIEIIRGVDVGGALETLTERQFVRTVGRKETPGRPFLYGTTVEFLRHFGLRSLEALPRPSEDKPQPEFPVQAAELQPAAVDSENASAVSP